MLWLILGSLVLSFLASLLLVPLVRWFAHRVGVVDAPDAERKLHRKPIALGGGVAVLGSVFLAFAGIVSYDRYYGGFQLEYIEARWYGLFFCAGAMLVVGLIDDKWNLRGRQKLLAQILIISVMVGTGTIVETLSLFGYQLNLGPLAFPATVIWLLLAVNALNLIDGADGVATTAGIFISLGLAVLSWEHDSILSALVAFCLAGSLIGFLNFNRPPASIFLGDAGSMVIGLFVGVLAVWSSMKSPTLLASAPVAILAIPLFDSSAAVLRRWLTGRSIYATDRAHLHHLLEAKFGHHGMLLMVAGLCMFTTLLAVLSAHFHMPWLAGLGVLLALGVLVFTRSFGHAEFRLIVIRLSSLIRSFLISPSQCEDEKTQSSVPMQGIGNWASIWEPMVDFAKEQDFARIKIDLNLAWLHEGYHANWSAVRLPDRAQQLLLKVPLFAVPKGHTEQICIGRLEVIARGDDPLVYQRLAALTERLTVLGKQLNLLLQALELDGREESLDFSTSDPTERACDSTPSSADALPAANAS